MNKSAFQFSKPTLTELQFSINEGFKREENKPIELSTNFHVTIHRSPEKTRANVAVRVEIGCEESKEAPYTIKAEMASAFMWGEMAEDRSVDVFLRQNATALLISYLRPVISHITSLSRNVPFDLPFVDVTTMSSDEQLAIEE